MTRWLGMLLLGAALAAGADLSYKPGSKLNLVFASGVRCEVKVVTRAAEWVTVAPAKVQPMCPAGMRRLDLRNVAGIQGDPSMTRRVLGWTIGAFGMFAAQGAGFAGHDRAVLPLLAGSVTGGILVGKSGYKWTIYLNTSALDEVQ